MKNDVKIVAFLLLITAAILVVVMVTKPSGDNLSGVPAAGESGEGDQAKLPPGDEGAPIIPPSDDGAFQTYTVKQGDTLDKIAKTVYAAAKGYSLDKKKQLIVDANKEELGSKKEVRPKMKLRIPKLPAAALEDRSQPIQTPKPTPKPTPKQTPKAVETAKAVEVTPTPAPTPAPRKDTYIVKKGDYLYTIAKKVYGNGKYYTKIIEANPGLNPNNLKVGMELKIPPLEGDTKKDDSAKPATDSKSAKTPASKK